MRHFSDTVEIKDARTTADGYLVADVRVARTGIQVYRGVEVDPDNTAGLRDRAAVAVYRPPEAVFDARAMATYAHRPVTIDHPSKPVTSATWRDVAVGQTGGEVTRDGDFIRVPLVLMDAAAIEAAAAGKRQLSMGYSAEMVFGDGVTPDGQKYQAIQTNLRMNHVALCRAARGGSELSIGDGGNKNMPTRTILVDEVPVELTDQSAAVVTKAMDRLREQLKAAETALADSLASQSSTKAEHDRAMAAKDAEIAELKKTRIQGAALDALVASRSALVSKAKSLVTDVETVGKTDADIRRAVVATVRGADAINGKSDAYIEAAFDLLDAAGKPDPVLTASRDDSKRKVFDAASDDAAYAASVTQLNAWRK